MDPLGFSIPICDLNFKSESLVLGQISNPDFGVKNAFNKISLAISQKVSLSKNPSKIEISQFEMLPEQEMLKINLINKETPYKNHSDVKLNSGPDITLSSLISESSKNLSKIRKIYFK